MISSGLLSCQWILQREASKRVFMWCSYHFCSIHNGRQNLIRFWSTTKVKTLTHNEGSTLLLYDHTDPVHLVSDPDHLLELYWYDVIQICIQNYFLFISGQCVRYCKRREVFWSPRSYHHISTAAIPIGVLARRNQVSWPIRYLAITSLQPTQERYPRASLVGWDMWYLISMA